MRLAWDGGTLRCGAVVQSLGHQRAIFAHSSRPSAATCSFHALLAQFHPAPSQRRVLRICTSVSFCEVRHAHRQLRVWRGSLRRRWLMSIQSVPRPTPAPPGGPCSSLPLGRCPRRLRLGDKGQRKTRTRSFPSWHPAPWARQIVLHLCTPESVTYTLLF